MVGRLETKISEVEKFVVYLKAYRVQGCSSANGQKLKKCRQQWTVSNFARNDQLSIVKLTQLARWRASMRISPILTSTTSQGAIFYTHNSGQFAQGFIKIFFPLPVFCIQTWSVLSGTMSYPLLKKTAIQELPNINQNHHFPVEVRATRWFLGAGFFTPSQTSREKPLFNLEVVEKIKKVVTLAINQSIIDECLSNDPRNAKEESYKQVIIL